jgi:hypothetical protein
MRSQANPREERLQIVGSTRFGRYPKISVEETFNCIISDNFLVDYAGYSAMLDLVPGGTGRGVYASTAARLVVAVVSNKVFIITQSISGLNYQFAGELLTEAGDVFIAENNNAEIAITDYSNIYVYNYSDNSFKIGRTSGGDFTLPPGLINPGRIAFQNGRLIVAGTGTQEWYLSDFNDATVWPNDPQNIGEFQTKTDTVQAPVRFPGRGNLLFVFGYTVVEPWTDVGNALFPYEKSSTYNIDYGTVNAATIAANEDIIVWLSANEQSGLALMYSTGGEIKRISTDGIDFKFSQLSAPQDSYGFLFRQDGHLIYQFVFTTDNLSYIYDFNTDKFFTITDENLNHHIAKSVVFFGNSYYFVSTRDGKFYEFDTSQTSYTYSLPNTIPVDKKPIPRIRICPPIRLANQDPFIGKTLSFTIEQGEHNPISYYTTYFGQQQFLMTEDGDVITTENGDPIITNQGENAIQRELANMAVDLSISRDGGETFGNQWRQNMNPTGKRKSRFQFRRLGRMNDCSVQLRFWGLQRFTCTDGTMEFYQ